MDFIGGALPNVMFIVGIMAIGIGLGIEFKVIEIKAELGKSGRIAAFAVGAVLIGISIFLYIRPSETAGTPAAPVSQAGGAAPTAVPATPVPSPEATPAADSSAALTAPGAASAATAPPSTAPPASAAAAAAPADVIAAVKTAVDDAVDEGDLDPGIAQKLIELLDRLDQQLVTGQRGEAAKTKDELEYNIKDAVEDNKLTPSAGLELLTMIKDIP